MQFSCDVNLHHQEMSGKYYEGKKARKGRLLSAEDVTAENKVEKKGIIDLKRKLNLSLRARLADEKICDHPSRRHAQGIKSPLPSVRFAQALQVSSRDAADFLIRNSTSKAGKSNKCQLL